MIKRGNSRGMSSIIATLLIIVFSLIAVGIVWVVIKNVLVNQSELMDIKKEFFAESLQISSLNIQGSAVSISLKRLGGELSTQTTTEITETVTVIDTDIFSVVDLSGSMTQCIESSQWCCNNILMSNSHDNNLRICYGANTNKNISCISACQGTNYLISGNSNGELDYGYAWNENQWGSNSVIANTLPDVGSFSTPSVFYKDSSWYLIAGESGGNFKGFSWDGTQWLSNSTINASLPDIGSNSAPNVFQKDNVWYLIAGESGGNFKGFSWDGTQWVINSVINASLPDIGFFSTPFVFYKDSSWYLIAGESDGVFNGYVWDSGNNRWIVNITINISLPDIGANSTPYVFKKGINWSLISGNGNGRFNGYTWNGTNWRTNLTANASLPDIGTNSAPALFFKNSTWIDRLTPTKEANKALVSSILSASPENRIGLVAYNETVINSNSTDLTNNLALLNSKIDSWQARGSTCICCGINNASDRLQVQSPSDKSRKIIVMSDGEANYECTPWGYSITQGIADAIQASDNEHNDTSINSTIYSIGAGEDVNQNTLIEIANHGGGKYYSAINVTDLIEVYRTVAEEIRKISIISSRFNYLYIIFYNSTNDYSEKIFEIPDNLEVKNYQINLAGKLEGEIIKIDIYPVILLKSGKEEIGPLFDSWTKQG